MGCAAGGDGGGWGVGGYLPDCYRWGGQLGAIYQTVYRWGGGLLSRQYIGGEWVYLLD